jgi:hypothetical protein
LVGCLVFHTHVVLNFLSASFVSTGFFSSLVSERVTIFANLSAFSLVRILSHINSLKSSLACSLTSSGNSSISLATSSIAALCSSFAFLC